MIKVIPRSEKRKKRHKRVRKKVFGTAERPRMCVFRSLKHIYVQVIDDEAGHTLVAASSLSPEFRERTGKNYGGDVEAAKIVGEIIAQKCLEKGIKKVVFDRGGYKYHGRVAALAEAARQAGLEF